MTAYSSTALQALAIAAGFTPGAQAQTAARYALAISGGDPSYSSGGRVGLWGVPPGTAGYTAAQLASPTTNAIAAHAMWASNGNAFPTVTVGGSVGDAIQSIATTTATGGLNLVPGAVENAVPGLKGIDAIAADADKSAAWITNPSNWLHIAYVVGGAALVLAGLVVIARPAVSGTANTVAKVASGNTSVGRAAKAVGGVQKRRAAKARTEQQRIAREGERIQRENDRAATGRRRQQRIEERHGWARAREQRAAEAHAKKTKTEESGSGD